MPEENEQPRLTEENWNCTSPELAVELRSFVEEMKSFTPEHFVQIKFHLLRHSTLSQDARDELCKVSIHNKLCPKCDFLYVAKECLLWYRLFDLVNRRILERAPPCIKNAYKKKSIRTVINYLTAAHLISPPFYKVRRAPSCAAMKRWGYCSEDQYCKAMEFGNTIEYTKARERVKQSKPSKR